MGLFYLIPYNLQLLNPLKQALFDFELTDIVFSKLRIEEFQKGDTNIVLVNIGNLSRKGIAEEIKVINQYEPKIIGIDAFFRSEKDYESDSLLAEALNSSQNIVLVSKLNYFNSSIQKFDSLELSHEKFSRFTNHGFANLVINEAEGFRTSRIFSPKESVKDSAELAFGVKIVQLIDENSYQALKDRNNTIEIINYKGNLNKFYCIDVRDIFNSTFDKSFIKDKIVLMGYLGPELGTPTLDDVFFTPLNERYAGKTYPDMYGVVIHANIISMILHKSYIDYMSPWLSFVLAIVLCYLNIVLFYYIFKNYRKWYVAITKLTQLLEAIFILFLLVLFFYIFNYKIDITLSLLAILLLGDLLEIYEGFIKKMITKFKILRRN